SISCPLESERRILKAPQVFRSPVAIKQKGLLFRLVPRGLNFSVVSKEMKIPQKNREFVDQTAISSPVGSGRKKSSKKFQIFSPKRTPRFH
ncbi:MAG: hypothetical protein Q4D55_06580, partial [Eubacteriales bacterium]|nr:hypothetical protein [Eubacteriales bacterium]